MRKSHRIVIITWAIALAIGLLVAAGALYMVSHRFVPPVTEHTEGVTVSFAAADRVRQPDLGDRWVLRIEGDATPYTLPGAAAEAISGQINAGNRVAIRYERATFHSILQLSLIAEDGTAASIYHGGNPIAAKRDHYYLLIIAVYVCFIAGCSIWLSKQLKKLNGAKAQ